MARNNIPGYLKHKTSGQAFCVINGRFIYLGKHGSKASRQRYQEVLSEHLANDKKSPPTRLKGEITIMELAVQYLEHAREYHADEPKTYHHCSQAMKPLVKHYGNRKVSEFGPASFKFLRDKWIKHGYSLTTIRKREGLLKSAFRWGVENELVAAETVYSLCMIKGLKVGRSKAKDPVEVPPVANEIVEQTLPLLPPIIAAMVQVQRLAGFRPQDVINLRSCDIDQSKIPWKYSPYTHKTKKRGKSRDLAIGPRARAILTPYLMEKADDPKAFLFSPADSMKLFRAEQRKNRKTKVQPSQKNRRKTGLKRSPGEKYATSSYNRAVGKACKKGGIEKWTVNQLRHSAGQEVRDQYGPEYAQAVLGHANIKTTEIYAKVSFEKAPKVMEEIG